MNDRRAYVTLLATSDYLPGVAALSASLAATGAKHPLHVLVTEDLPAATVARAERLAASVIRVPPITNPAPGTTYRHWNATYSKLRIFGLVQFEKLVFVDCDMVVCANLDDLFERPHFSAVNSGGMLPEHADWMTLNSGLLVLQPDASESERMLSLVGKLKTTDHGDQTFLHAYFPEWPQRADLHLDHGDNMFHDQVDRYAEEFGYRFPRGEETRTGKPAGPGRLIRVVHFVGGLKPWHRSALRVHLTGLLGGETARHREARSRWYAAALAARFLGRAQR